VERKRVDPHKLYGVVVKETDDLMLIHQNIDFQFDGYVVVRTKDITKSAESPSNDFCAEIMKKEGLWEKPPKNVRGLPLDAWPSLLTRFVGKVVILENEKTDDFYIGVVLEVGEKAVIIDYIDGVGDRMGEERIPYKKITQMRFGDRYSTLFGKYLKDESNL